MRDELAGIHETKKKYFSLCLRCSLKIVAPTWNPKIPKEKSHSKPLPYSGELFQKAGISHPEAHLEAVLSQPNSPLSMQANLMHFRRHPV